ncbi:MAG: S8 family peptidase, partial [Acidobacteriota bacterium]|nr:S8 family peptidase [Acidobacteriota bacterium]
MPPFPRDLPHLYLRGSGKSEPYTSTSSGPRHKLPQRDRYAHAQALRSAITKALTQAGKLREQVDPALFTGTPGFYLDFQVPPDAEAVFESLEARRKGIELVSVSKPVRSEPARATVFVPAGASDYFLKKVDAYETQETRTGKPKNEALLARIDSVTLSALLSLYTDDPGLLPAPGEKIWWEVWLRREEAREFDSIARKLNLSFQSDRLVFPDREVRLVFADAEELGRLFLNSDCIAELRLAKDAPSLFLSWSNSEQALWAQDLLKRLVLPQNWDVSVCVLDTGITRAHPLLMPCVHESDVHLYDPTWAAEDRRGHGTNMAGLALYGDLMAVLQATGSVQLTHCVESVKILPDAGENSPRLYGAITREAIARAEITAPDRQRATCLAVTSDLGTSRGRPSSWSAAADQLCFGDGDFRRLILISAGNIRTHLSQAEYPARNDLEPIENPAQAWNA